MRRIPIRRRARGFSLVEIAMVLAIGALIISGVMLFYANATNANMANDTITEFTVITAAAHSIFAGQPDYTAMTDAIMFGAPEIPNKWKNATYGLLESPFHSLISMVVINGEKTLFITLHGVPAVICHKIVTTDPGPGQWWTVGGAVPVYGSPVGAAMSPDLANTACGYGPTAVADLAYAIN